MIIKADLHTHTLKSFDGRQSYEQLIAAAKTRGLDAVAITEHDCFEPLPEGDDILLIPACEFSTDAGHITGLFLEGAPQQVGRDAEKAIKEIHRLGGIAVWAHPFQKGNEPALPVGIDAIETANARADHKHKGANEKAAALAREANLPAIGGSDAHSAGEVGNAYTAIECEACDLASLKAAILNSNCRAVLVKDTPRRMIGLSQLARRRRMGGLKNLCIGLLYLTKSFLIDIKER